MSVELEEQLLQQEPELVIDYVVASARPAPPDFPENSREIRALADSAKKELLGSNGANCYNRLMGKFTGVLEWAVLCWDHIVTVRGCRFLPRDESEKNYHRGCYRAFTQKDYRRLVNRIFKDTLLEYDAVAHGGDFPGHVSSCFWGRIEEEYDRLRVASSPEERDLTGYSYLRCIPYTFLNGYHEEKMREALGQLDPDALEMIELYFLKFMKVEAVAEQKGTDIQKAREGIARALAGVRSIDPLCYALLIQMERY